MTTKNHQPTCGLMLLVLIVILTACNSGSNSNSSTIAQDENKDTGSISFEVIWAVDDPEAATAASETNLNRAAVKSEGGIDCVGRGIATIGVTLYDSENEEITSKEWLCDEHSGVIDGIPAPQSGVTLLFVAKNENYEIIFRGEKGDLTINVGSDNHAGAINVLQFKPPAVEIAEAPNTIKWNAVSHATSYWVTISDKADFSNKIIDESCETTEFQAFGLEPGVLHYVKIYAQDDRGLKSAASEVGTLTTQQLAAVPQNIIADNGLRQITLNWEGADATRFNVYWSTTPNVLTTNYSENGGKIEDIEPDTTPFVHENLQDNTVYYYVITAENSIGQESAVSAEVFATAVGMPYSPADVTATAEERKVTLNWTTATGFTYNIYWSTESAVTTTNNQGKVENIDADTWVHGVDEGCTGVKHYYIVTANNALGESAPSEEISAGPGWILMEGGSGGEAPKASAVDADGNIYTAVSINYSTDDWTVAGNTGGYDIVIFKHNRFGVRQWVITDGGPENEYVQDIGVDDAGNIYIVGVSDTKGWSGDQPEDKEGKDYAFIKKLDPAGKKIWGWIFGNFDEGMNPGPNLNLAVDGDGTSYTAATFTTVYEDETTDKNIVVLQFDAEDGEMVWTRQDINSEQDDKVTDITLDDQGNIYLTGWTDGNLNETQNLGISDAFAAKLAPEDGAVQWLKLIGTSMDDQASAITVHQNHCYISGFWEGMQADLFIAKFNTENGAHQWTNVVEEAAVSHDNEHLAVTQDGTLILGTHTMIESFDGQPNAGGYGDVLLMAYDAEGNRHWSRLYGTPNYDTIAGLRVDADGYAYITGWSYGNFGGIQNAGEEDVFLWKLHTGN